MVTRSAVVWSIFRPVSTTCMYADTAQLLGVLRFLVDYLNYEHKRAALLPQQASLGAAHEHWENCEPRHAMCLAAHWMLHCRAACC